MRCSLTKALLLLSLVVAPTGARAEPADGPKTRLVTGHADRVFDSPADVTVADADELAAWTATTTPELLSKQPALRVPLRYSAGGAPIVRAMTGARVALVVDGVRLNTAITSADAHRPRSTYHPNALLAMVDPFGLGRVAVARGAGSVVFGSDAIGGVIALDSVQQDFAARRAWDASGGAIVRFASQNKGLVGRVYGQGHMRAIGLRLGVTLRRFGDLVGGRDLGEQRFTDYFDGSGDAAATWKISEDATLRLRYQTVRRRDLPRGDISSPRDFSLVDLAARDLVSLRYQRSSDSKLLSDVDLTLSLQSLREDRERFVLAADRVDRERDSVLSIGARLTARSKLPYNTLSYGADVYHDRVASSAEFELIAGRQVTQLSRGRFVDGSSYTRFGFFAVDRVSIGKLAVELGGRLAGWNVDIAADPANQLAAISNTEVTAVGSARARFLVGDGLNLITGVSQGFHAPNIADYTTRGCSGSRFLKPNADLSPERSVTVEAGVKLDLFGVLHGAVFYYFTHLDNAIIHVPSTLSQGGTAVSSMQCPDAVGATRRVPVYTPDNAKNAAVHGVEGRLTLELGKGWRIFGWLAWAHGRATFDLPGNASEPLSLTPPLGGLFGVRYASPSGLFSVQADLRWATRQDRLSNSVDRGDAAICPSGPSGCQGTAGFAALNLRGAFSPKKWLRLTLALQNLTDEPYRIHGSAVPAPGVSAVAGLELRVK